MKKFVIFISSIIAIDFITKLLTYYYIPLTYGSALWMPSGIQIFKNFLGINFSITHVANKGAAWGTFSNFQPYLLILRIGLILSMIIYLALINKNKAAVAPFTLIIAGAIGNVIDFFLYGHVIDMFHFVLWGFDFAVFNFADTSITIGIAWLCLVSYFGNSSKKRIATR